VLQSTAPGHHVFLAMPEHGQKNYLPLGARMKDTPEAVQNFYQTLVMGRSAIERLKMGCAMFDTARTLALANLRTTSQTDDELRVRLFVRTYGGDFDADTAARIVAWLAAPC
jgi:hypothetical protein